MSDQSIHNASLFFNLSTTPVPTRAPPVKPDCSFYDFMLWGCVVMFLCFVGYIGNTLSFLALKKDKANAAIRLLQSLSISDIVLLLSVNITDSIPYICNFTKTCPDLWKVWPYVRYVWLLTPVAHMCSIWLVVLVAANRYWAVCRPHHVTGAWSLKRTQVYIACVVVGSIVFNSPRIFEYKITSATQHHTDKLNLSNQTVMNVLDIIGLKNTSDPQNRPQQLFGTSANFTRHHHMIEVKTELGNQSIYKIGYKVIVVNILLVLLPLSLLLVSSIWIIKSLKLSKKKTTNRENNASSVKFLSGSKNKKTTASREVTITLVTVVLVAVICQTPLAVFHCVRYLYRTTCGSAVYYLESASKLLVNANSCANFFIYYVLSLRFRRLLASVVLCKKDPKRFSMGKTSKNNKENERSASENREKPDYDLVPNKDNIIPTPINNDKSNADAREVEL